MGSLAVQRDRDARGVGKGLAATAEEAGIGDLSGMHRIDPDVPWRELQDCGFCQVAKPPFARFFRDSGTAVWSPATCNSVKR